MSSQEDLEQLVQAARQGKLKPLVLIFGDQDYLVKQAYDRLLEAAVPQDLRDFNLEQHDGARAEPGALLDSLAIPPMLAGPKAVGVYDARYFMSKANVAELLEKARDRFASGEASQGFRQLGRAVSLAGWTWEEALAAGPDGWTDALELKEAEAALLKGAWFLDALNAAVNQALPLPAGDDAGALADGLASLLEQWIEGTVLICACGSVDQRKKLAKLFLEKGQVLDFRRTDKPGQPSQAARPFLRMVLDQRKLKAPASLGERLLASYGDDLGVLEREVEKLEAYAWPRTDLAEADLNAVGTPRAEDNVFKLIDALGEQKLGEALRLLRSLTAQDPESRYQILGLVTGEVRKLVLLRALIDEGKLPSKGSTDPNSFRMQVHPRLAKELPPALAAWWKRSNAWGLYFALKRAKAFKTAQLHVLLRALSAGDLAAKSGGASPLDLLQEVCVRICGGREEAVL
jgi:DNA polymerase-3 subunit delta